MIGFVCLCLSARCFVTFSLTRGRIYAQVINSIEIIVFFLLALAYGAMWMRIRTTAQLLTSNNASYQQTAKIMMIFVAAFILQWWPLSMSNIWINFGRPPWAILALVGFFVNLGGVYNCLAYTVIRRRLQQKQSAHVSRDVGDHHHNSSTTN